MKQFDSIREIDTGTNTGKLFLAAMSILSGSDFKSDDRYGSNSDSLILMKELVELAEYVFNFKWEEYNQEYFLITDYVDVSLDEGKILLTCIEILTTDECKNGHYGGHEHVDNILRRIRKMTLIKERERSIDLII